jgi:lipopolysaccharide/colanic/teichoic acid biosynthesis glycosyltransferase
MAKRVFDLLFAGFAISLLWPIILVVWLMVKLDDGGPLFYRQIRVGKKGRPFRIIKFRTMGIGAERTGPSFTVSGDHRITRVGRMLRKSKVDELPQIWNILRGEMSFVGPRPEVPQYVALYTSEQRRVLAFRPGITDVASIAFRNEETLLAAAPNAERFYVEHCLPEKIALNLAYADRANVFRDFLVIFRTIGLVWLGR